MTRNRSSLSADKENGVKWNPYEIILFYLQTKLEYFAKLLCKCGDDVNGKL
uniref:Uncharacterized protein n=1 Tax=Elaeophora elaphi TaxID=1147741 RepID=A0A0R3RLR7_9BILA